MLNRLKQHLVAALIGMTVAQSAIFPVQAQTATLLPNAVQQYTDSAGVPVANGSVGYYQPNGFPTKKTVWQDAAETTPQTNPVPLDAAGRPQPAGQTYGSGCYQQIVNDQNNVQVWSAVTCSTGSGSSGTTTAWSEGVMVGTILPWANNTLPAKYLYAAGQAIARTSYPDLFTALVYQTTITCSLGVATISLPAATTDRVPIGAPIEASCFAPGTTVIAKSSGLLTLSTNATITISTGISIFPYGNGNGSSTFNVPDTRGYVIAGRNNMNSSVSSRMTQTYFGSNPNAVNAKGGNEFHNLLKAEVPDITSTASNNITVNYGGYLSVTSNPQATVPAPSTGSAYAVYAPSGGADWILNKTASTPTANTITVLTQGTSGGTTGTPFNMYQPTVTADYIIKALPDDMPSGPGVTSIQGMTGAISCAGTAITCTAQTITVNMPVSTGVTSLGGMTGALGCGTGLNCGAGTVSTRLNYADYGIKCDGTTDDGPGFTAAYNAINAGTIGALYLPAGRCKLLTNSFLNTFTTVAGTLTTPGIRIIGQGNGSTVIDTAVANGYAISVNPDWAALHKSMFSLTPATGGSGALPTNTYYVQTTVTDPGSNEINVSPAKQVTGVTGPTGRININLQPLNAGYCYNIYIGTTSTPANYATVSGANAVCLGGNQSVNIDAIGTAHAVPTNKTAVWQQATLQNLSITNSTAATNASGVLWFRVGYSTMSGVYMKGLTGDGLDIPNWTGDNDGSFVVTIDQSKFDTISGWCVMAAGNTLEFSNFTVSNTVFNLCGTSPSGFFSLGSISSITNANPGVVTTTSPFGWTAGDYVWIQGVAGMTLANGVYRACAPVTTTTFSLCDLNSNPINTTSLGAYTGSGLVEITFRPPQMQTNGNGPTMSGAIAYTGLISNFINNGFTQNKNTNFYFSEAGANDNSTLVGNDMENTYGVGLYMASVINLRWQNGECLTASSLGPTTYCMILGTGLNKGGAQNVTVDGVKVRSDVGVASVGFAQLQGAGAVSYPNTTSVKNVYWQTFTGTKYTGFLGSPFPLFWARFDGKTGTTCTLKDSYNIASCTRNGTGDYTFTFTTPSLDANYAFTGAAMQTGVAPGVIAASTSSNVTTTSLRVTCFNSTTAAAMDCDTASISGHGNPY